ncbi:MAG TPA: hypothetical protein VF516_30290 [Kofleriaceae bacterium]
MAEVRTLVRDPAERRTTEALHLWSFPRRKKVQRASKKVQPARDLPAQPWLRYFRGMSSYLDSIPSAVATIVSSCYGSLLAGVGKGPSFQKEMEKHVIDFTDQLTRTIAKALADAEAGEPSGKSAT